MRRFWSDLLLGTIVLGNYQAAMSQLNDPKIISYYQDIPAWNMLDENNSINYMYMPTVQGLGNDYVLGIKTVIYPDGRTEAFDMTRQTGFNNNSSEGRPWRNGGYTELFRFDRQAGATNDFLATLDRGSCEPIGNPLCEGEEGKGFFNATYPFTSRAFSGTSNTRGKIKVDYVCTSNCPAPATSGPYTVNTMWMKLGTWDMESVPSKTLVTSGITAANIVDMDALIYSDPGSGPQVDNLEHVALKMRQAGGGGLTPMFRGRGGILWYGMGCGPQECEGTETGLSRLRLYAGHRATPPSVLHKSSYRGMGYIEDPEGSQDPIPYKSTSLSNRGWAKIEYTGTASSTSQPYFMRTKVYELGPWSMPNSFETSIPFSGIDPYRVTGLSTVIRSDKQSCGPGCMPGWTYTDFHRPSPGHKPSISAKTGGVTYVDANSGVIRVAMAFVGDQIQGNYFVENPHYGDIRDENGQAYNRGYVRVDYLAAECLDGTGGYTRGIIGSFSANGDDCHGVKGTGSSADLVLQTKASAFSTGTQAIYYAYKTRPSGTNYTATAKVMALEYSGSNAKAGVMMRLNTSSTGNYAAVVVTGNSVQFIRKAINGSSTTTVTGVTAPCWVRVEKTFDTYKGYYSLNGTTWTRIGPDANITTSGAFLVGLASTGNGLTTSGYTGVSF